MPIGHLKRIVYKSRNSLLTVFPNDAARRQLGCQRAKLNDASDILAQPLTDANLRHLTDWRVVDMAHDSTVLQEEVVPFTLSLPGVERFAETRVNQLYLARPNIRRALELYHFEDVYLVHNLGRFSIFRRGAIDPRCSAMPGVEAIRKIEAGDVTELGDMAFCGDHWQPDNPAHFVSDQLTRALQFRDQLGYESDRILLHHTNAPLCQYVQAKLDPGFINMEPNRIYHLKRLGLLSSSRFDRPHGHPFWFLDQGALDAICGAAQAGLSPDPGPSVYLSRSDTTRRRLRNEAVLEAELTARGFKVLHMGALSGQDQLQAIHGAGCIVAPHGGALLNLIAARKGTRVVELFNPQIGTLAFAGIALARGLDYRFHIGQPVAPKLREDNPWQVDIDAVLAHLPD